MKIVAAVVTLVVALVTSNTARAEDWDSRGWVKLGERSVTGRYDHDKISVGKYEGRFTKLTMHVEKSEIELLDFEITFTNGERFHPALRHFFREGSRARVIDLPGDARVIKDINLRYKNLPGGGSASVAVWGWRADGASAARDGREARDTGGARRASDPGWDSSGWRLLGERSVTGRYDHDTIAVGAYKGRFDKLAMVVTDSDLELLDFEVRFASGRPHRPATRHFFKEGSRSRVFDLPGDDRVVRSIELRYKNLPGGGSAKVQIWGK